MMTKKEIIKRLEELDKIEFLTLMIDRWSSEDYRTMDKIAAEREELQNKLKDLEKMEG